MTRGRRDTVEMDERMHATTILTVRRGSQVVIGGDGQVTLGQTVMKASAKKVRRMHEGKVIAGFAGSAADGVALFERLEGKLKEANGNLARAAVELAKEWRSDRVLRKLEALIVVADTDKTFLITGTGDVIEPEGGVVAIGSGGPYALAAARALVEAGVAMSAREIVERALKIAGEICIYTNQQLAFEEI